MRKTTKVINCSTFSAHPLSEPALLQLSAPPTSCPACSGPGCSMTHACLVARWSCGQRVSVASFEGLQLADSAHHSEPWHEYGGACRESSRLVVLCWFGACHTVLHCQGFRLMYSCLLGGPDPPYWQALCLPPLPHWPLSTCCILLSATSVLPFLRAALHLLPVPSCLFYMPHSSFCQFLAAWLCS